MKTLFATVLFAGAVLGATLVAPFAHAQDASSDEIEAAVQAALPEGWQISRFTILEEAPHAVAALTGGSGKIVGAPVGEAGGVSSVKIPIEAQDPVYFAGSLVATDEIFEPLYALNGTAVVRPLFDEGFEIPVTGAYTGEVVFHQGGVAQLGRPLSGFDLPTVVEGTPEAEAFEDARSAATAEGTLSKLMNEEGEPL